MKTIYYLYALRLINKAIATNIIPAGWYSSQQEGSHDNQHIVMRLESSNKNQDINSLPSFTYWNEELPVDNAKELIADN